MEKKYTILLLFFLILCTNVFGTSVLTQSMIDSFPDSFVVKRDYVLNGQNIILPKGYVLKFSGGTIDEGSMTGTKSKIIASKDKNIFGLDIKIKGSWNVDFIYDQWFKFDTSRDFVSNTIIENILSLTDDNYKSHIYFGKGRIYYFNLPYNGRADLGEVISYNIVGGKKKRNYNELYGKKFDNLKVFTIPSNTSITLDAELCLNPTKQGVYFIFWEYGKKNVLIEGSGVIRGDSQTHIFAETFNADSKYYGELGNVINCFKCSNFIIKGITVADAFGDCIVFQGANLAEEKGRRWADGLKLENVRILNARRNGVTIGARNVSIKNCYFKGCGSDVIKGTPPRSAIDFEPDDLDVSPDLYIDSVVMQNCVFENNYIDVNSFKVTKEDLGHPAVTIRNCSFHSPIHINTSSWMRFENCYIERFNTENYKASVFVGTNDFAFLNCTFGSLQRNLQAKVYLQGRNKFENCKVLKYD